MLNAELERKYGASLSGSQGAGTSLVRSKMSSSHLKAHSMPPMFAEDDVSDIDQKLKEKLEQVKQQLTSRYGNDVNEITGSSSISASGVLVPYYSGPRETLEDRLGMFYYYWNPEKVSKAAIVVQHFKGSEDLVNQALHSKYFCDLDTPEKDIMRKAHMASKLYKFFELIMPKNMIDKMAAQVPRLVVQYFGRDLELNEWLERNYGVALDVVFLSAV